MRHCIKVAQAVAQSHGNAVPILVGDHNVKFTDEHPASEVLPLEWTIVPSKEEKRDFVFCPRLDGQLQVRQYTNDRVRARDGAHWAIEAHLEFIQMSKPKRQCPSDVAVSQAKVPYTAAQAVAQSHGKTVSGASSSHTMQAETNQLPLGRVSPPYSSELDDPSEDQCPVDVAPKVVTDVESAAEEIIHKLTVFQQIIQVKEDLDEVIKDRLP